MGQLSPLEAKAIKQIKGVLTDTQIDRVPVAIEDIRMLGPAGLPMPALERVDLSKEQWTKIHAMLIRTRPVEGEEPGPGAERPNFEQIHSKLFALLTDDQKKAAKQFERRGPGGPGFGGPGQGGPPPDGGGE